MTASTREPDKIPRAAYVRTLRPELPADVFERAVSRLGFLPVHLAVIVVATVAIASDWLPWPVVPLLSLAIGASFAGMTFIAHEVLHGAIVRNKRLQHALGWLGFLPFTVSPRLWIAWHNGLHHAHANHPDDPDSYPTLEGYRRHRAARFSVDHFSFGARRWRGALSLFFGFTGQSIVRLLFARSTHGMTAAQYRRVLGETALGVAVWATVAAMIGFVPFVFAFVLPLVVANACVMAFILTNHSLSPRVSINDPLASGLTVTTPRLVSWLTLGFGFHVEHHLFPAMSTRHAPVVRKLLLARWPERYRSMSLVEALRRLHRGARVYKDSTTLYDPRSGTEQATL